MSSNGSERLHVCGVDFEASTVAFEQYQTLQCRNVSHDITHSVVRAGVLHYGRHEVRQLAACRVLSIGAGQLHEMTCELLPFHDLISIDVNVTKHLNQCRDVFSASDAAAHERLRDEDEGVEVQTIRMVLK
jgi:hypothetical protein